ncbi:MAG: hypothetical protein CL691_03530 [Cellvibrionales bacterium]|nr:hypothetical protein [Cellvibrionales bacterium]
MQPEHSFPLSSENLAEPFARRNTLSLGCSNTACDSPMSTAKTMKLTVNYPNSMALGGYEAKCELGLDESH